jgi:hypothetical protein
LGIEREAGDRMRRTIIQIVPQLPPPPEGVGSFAMSLAGALRARSGIESRFLVASPSWVPPLGAGEFSAVKIPAATPAMLCDALAAATAGAPATVLLHYANYGYEPRGCPSWLIRGLMQWKASNKCRLVTIFHEISAVGPPWRSSFWLSGRQRRLAASLAVLSDGLATSGRIQQRILLRWVPDKVIGVLPVFSTVGEPSETQPLAVRARRLVVFGGPGTRDQAYRTLMPEIELACRTLEIEEICDVGPAAATRALDLPVRSRHLGPLPPAEVSELLANSVAGFLAYPAPLLPKSTVFAAYCAHRALPVCAWRRPRLEVEPLPPCWNPKSKTADLGWDQLQDIADRAHAWYQDHALDHHAAAYHGLLFP